MEKPLVSICCQTFNHGAYLKECLDGFVNQKTNFKYEILVHDDASTDNTPKILKEYENKYPDLFRCVYQEENQFGKLNSLVDILHEMALGKYIAICEGDDYWIDENKLQKQINFLEANPEYTITGHSVRTIDENKKTVDFMSKEGEVTFEDILLGKGVYTLSMVYRNILKFSPKINKYPAGDFFIKASLLDNGKGYLFNSIMGMYRKHNGGIWSTQSNKEIHRKTLQGYRNFLKDFPKRKTEIIYAILKYKKKHGLTLIGFDSYILMDCIGILNIGLKKIKKRIGL